jgi:ABC-type sulfate transport system permease component
MHLMGEVRPVTGDRPTASKRIFHPFAKLNPIPLRFVLLIAIIACFTAYPIALLFLSSFQVSPPGQPIAWGLEGWRMAFSDAAVPKALWNTFVLGFTRVAITTVLSVFFAWVITRTDTPGKGFIEFMIWLGFFCLASDDVGMDSVAGSQLALSISCS